MFTRADFGNLSGVPRGLLREQGLVDWDISTIYEVTGLPRLAETGSSEFQVKFFNTPDGMNPGLPGISQNNDNFTHNGICPNCERVCRDSFRYPANACPIRFGLGPEF